MEPLSITSSKQLNSGASMPLLGLGVFQMNESSECIIAIEAALACGYRHIDTAEVYGNEREVGQAIAQSSVPREELFITSKVMPRNFGREAARRCVEGSLKKLGLEYIDLYLIHWPTREKTEESYEVLQAMRDEGRLRSIGVSNFTERRFEEQYFKRIDEVPAVNQIERHPHFVRSGLVEYCKNKGIQVEAYSPLARGGILSEAMLKEIGSAHGKSSVQVAIRWQLQQGVVVIPKSSRPERIESNADVFDFQLSTEEIDRIESLDRNESIIAWRPEPDWF